MDLKILDGSLFHHLQDANFRKGKNQSFDLPHYDRGVVDRRVPAIACSDMRFGLMVTDLVLQLFNCEKVVIVDRENHVSGLHSA